MYLHYAKRIQLRIKRLQTSDDNANPRWESNGSVPAKQGAEWTKLRYDPIPKRLG